MLVIGQSVNVGYVRNTEPLSYEKRSSYTLELKAEDCGGRMSDTAVLTVNIRPLCQPGWTGKLIQPSSNLLAKRILSLIHI